jgi:putative copper export protein
MIILQSNLEGAGLMRANIASASGATSTGRRFLHPWLAGTLASLVMVALPTLADTSLGAGVPPIAEVAPPVDGLIVSRAAYVGLMLLAMGTAWFMLLVPVTAQLTATLRRALAVFAIAGLLAGGFNQQQLNTVAVAGFFVLLAASWRDHRGLLLGGVLVLAVSRALIGHPVSRDPAALLMPLMVLHVSCAAYWAGSLWPLHRLLGTETPAVAAAAVSRFSGLALAAVGALAIAGIITALLNLGTPDALLKTWYGQLLIMKFTWFTVLMGIAAYHKLRLSPRLAAGDQRAARHMRWGIRAEALIMLLVILLSALLASTPPEALPRKSAIRTLTPAVAVLASTASGQDQSTIQPAVDISCRDFAISRASAAAAA